MRGTYRHRGRVECNGVIDAVGFMSMSLPKEDTGVEEGVSTMNRLRSNH